MKKRTSKICNWNLYFVIILMYCASTSHSLFGQCPSGDIIITQQIQIDSFQAMYPKCSVLQGNLIIEESSVNGIQSLSGLRQIIGIKGMLTILNNASLSVNDGLDSLLFVDDSVHIGSNSSLSDVGLNRLYRVGNGLTITSNSQLVNLSSLKQLHYINGPLNINNNAILLDISGVENIYPGTIQSMTSMQVDLSIHDNPQLNSCQIRSICEAVTDSMHTFFIDNNGLQCSDPTEIAQNCNASTTAYCVDTVYNTIMQYADVLSFGQYGMLEEGWSAVSSTSYYGGMIFDDVHFYKKNINDKWVLTQRSEISYGYDSDIQDMSSTKDAIIISSYEENIGSYTWVKILEPDSTFTNWSTSFNYGISTYYITYPPIHVGIDSNVAVYSINDTIRVLEKSGNTWAQSFEFLTASGSQVGISGDFIVTSNPNAGGSTSASAGIYQRSGSNWSFSQSLELPNQIPINGDVEIKNEELIINNPSLGIHVFRRVGNTWIYDSEIPIPSNNIIRETCIYGNNVFVAGLDTNSSTNKAYFFQSEFNAWVLKDTFVDFTPISTPPSDGTFGYAMSLSQNKCLITEAYSGFYNHNYSYPFGDFVVLNCLDSQPIINEDPCFIGSINMTDQIQIDSFLILHPDCDQISGNLNIKEHLPGAISNLQGLSNIAHVNGNVTIQTNNGLYSLDDLSSLTYIDGSLTIFNNQSLSSISIPQLTSVDGEYAVVQNPSLIEITSQPKFKHIDATLNCYNNILLQDISGLSLLDPTYIQSTIFNRDDYEIHGNHSLSNCSIYTTCLGLSDGLHTADIRDNALGCNSVEEILDNCLPVILGQNCPQLLTLNGISIVEGRYKAAHTIKSNNLVNDPIWVIYESNNNVELNPGFEIQLGSEFHIKIKPCIVE